MSVFIPNGIDLEDLRRRLDDMQFAGLDLIVIEKWRALLDSHESLSNVLNAVSDATSSLESVADELGYEPEDHRIDIAGTLDDLEGETLPGGSVALVPTVRKVIEAAIAKQQKESDELMAKKFAESEAALRAALTALDEACQDPEQLTRAERKAEEERIAKAKAANKKKAPKVTQNPARQR